MNNWNIHYTKIKILLFRSTNIFKFSNGLITISFLLTYILYFSSLEKCTLGENRCCLQLKWMKKKIIEEALSCILSIVLFEFILLKKISKLHIIHFIIIFVLFYFYSHGIDFEDHGGYNIIFYFVLIIPSLILLFIFNKLILTVKKRNLIILIISILALFLFFRNLMSKTIINCSDWPKGLNNTYIENNKNKYGCQIQFPESCPYKIGKYFLDIYRYFPINCKNSGPSSKDTFIKKSKSPFINQNTFHIGFPLVNKNKKFLISNSTAFKQLYFDNLIDMNNSTLLDSLIDRKPERSIDFSKNKNGEMNIHLIKNESLSDERKKLERNITPYSNNIIVFYLDSVSRALSIRQLKKTLKFFENFILYKGNNNPKFPTENFHSFQFFKYHSLKYWTVGNYPALFYGNYRTPNNKLITSYLKKIGYITCYSSDNCNLDFTPHLHNYSFDETYDHQSILCDPSYIYSNTKFTCFYGKLYIEHMINYINQFWRLYKNNRKFTVLLTNFAHESSLERLKYIDNIIYEFFNKLFKDNLLKDTSIFLLSDHGVGVPSVYYMEKFFKLELVLPMFYLFVNDRKNITYESQYKHLKENQQTFITGFDIYYTILHLAYGDIFGTNITKNYTITNFGKSLFTKINQKKRSPKNYKLMKRYACI